jgi:hypothetical protein
MLRLGNGNKWKNICCWLLRLSSRLFCWNARLRNSFLCLENEEKKKTKILNILKEIRREGGRHKQASDFVVESADATIQIRHVRLLESTLRERRFHQLSVATFCCCCFFLESEQRRMN